MAAKTINTVALPDGTTAQQTGKAYEFAVVCYITRGYWFERKGAAHWGVLAYRNGREAAEKARDGFTRNYPDADDFRVLPVAH